MIMNVFDPLLYAMGLKEKPEQFIRTRAEISGPLTSKERHAFEAHNQKWINHAFQTEPVDVPRITRAIQNVYDLAGLKRPRVVVVSSPLMMAFAYGISATIWRDRLKRVDHEDTALIDTIREVSYTSPSEAMGRVTGDALMHAIIMATIKPEEVIYDAAYEAPEHAVDTALYQAMEVGGASARTDGSVTWPPETEANTPLLQALYAAIDAAVGQGARPGNALVMEQGVTVDPSPLPMEESLARACLQLAGRDGLAKAVEWDHVYESGAYGASELSFLTAFRDVMGLGLPKVFQALKVYEEAAQAPFRVYHPEFCLVSDFPEILKWDELNRPHCEDGPSHRWRDGWELYHWHGVRVPGTWIKNKDSLTPQIALTWENTEQRRAACEILGWHTILEQLETTIIDTDTDPQIGQLLEVDLPDMGRERFLKVQCATGRTFALAVPPKMKTALQANAWTYGLGGKDYKKLEIRT